MRCTIWYHLCNLKNVKKHPWRSVTFSSKLAGQKRGCFSHFLISHLSIKFEMEVLSTN